MRKTCTVTVNGKKFFAQCGDLLLDAALTSGVSLPHDCRSGVCGTCRVRVVEGRVFGGGGEDTVCACQARVISNLEIELDPVPHTMNVAGSVTRLERLAPDVIGVSIELAKPVHYLPGQYCKFAFRGFSERCYSPTYPLEGQPNERLLHLHIRTLADGQVSSALGREIRAGHRVKVIGPLGSAYFQPQHPGRTVLVASGTGFAPMWSVAVAAIFEQPRRELVFLAAARNLRSLYMRMALCKLAQFPNVTIIPIVSEPQMISEAIRIGGPLDYLPRLSPNDIVYAAGAPAMTASVARAAKSAGAKCHADPFVPQPKTQPFSADRLLGNLFKNVRQPISAEVG